MAEGPLIYKYPLDLTGINPNNLVLSEPHILPEGLNRAIVPNYGAFFSRSLVVKDDNGNELVPREQFKAVQLYQEATEKSGLEVTSVIVITDPNVSSNITIEYQAIGGEFSYSVLALREMIESLELDNRPVMWGEVIGTPDLFPPAPHLHDAGDLYGFEYLTEALDAVRRAIQTGNEGAFNLILENINELNSKILPVATVSEALSGSRNDLIMTPASTRVAFDYWYNTKEDTLLFEHIGNINNPHNVTKQQLDLDLVTNSNTNLTILEQHVVNNIPPKN